MNRREGVVKADYVSIKHDWESPFCRGNVYASREERRKSRDGGHCSRLVRNKGFGSVSSWLDPHFSTSGLPKKNATF